MIIELSTSWTRAEFRMALARLKGAEANTPRRKRLQVIVVITSLEQIPPAAHEFTVITRPEETTNAADDFLAQLASRLSGIANEVGIERAEEPRRLLEGKEYRAAVISAMSLLEARLRERLEKSQWPDVQRPMALQSLVNQAAQSGLFPVQLKAEVETWIRTRNAAVHSTMAVTKAQAQQIVEGVMRLISAWS